LELGADIGIGSEQILELLGADFGTGWERILKLGAHFSVDRVKFI
jgi:hypothetical protein